jgi:hypothetical protein
MARHISSRPVAQSDSEVLYAWATPSSHGTTTYETLVFRNGEMSCNCPAWVFKRGDERRCKHITLYEDEAQNILQHPDRTLQPRISSRRTSTPAPPRSPDPPLTPPQRRRTIRFTD